jgi:hypothetical protein
MSKKNRFRWQKNAPKPVSAQTEAAMSATLPAQAEPPILSPISPAQLAVNRANAQLSTGPRTALGKGNSSLNALKTALTGRTVLLPTDDVEEYAALVTGFERDLKPVGQVECELVQTIADCHWRLRRIQTLEHALYAHGHDQFADAFQNCPEEQRHSKILLQTHLTYEKQLRNLQIQEARLDRRISKAMAELRRLQAERRANESEAGAEANVTELNAPPQRTAAQDPQSEALLKNGFDFARQENPADLLVAASNKAA